MSVYDVNNRQVQMALVLKMSQCHRENLTAITYDEIEKIFDRLIWRHRKPESLHAAINDIFELSTDQMIGYLAKITELEAYQSKIDDYKDVYSDNEN